VRVFRRPANTNTPARTEAGRSVQAHAGTVNGPIERSLELRRPPPQRWVVTPLDPSATLPGLVGRNLHRYFARTVADHLDQVADLLREAPKIDVLMLAAIGTARVIRMLGRAGERVGNPLPAQVLAAAPALHDWATATKAGAYGRILPANDDGDLGWLP